MGQVYNVVQAKYIRDYILEITFSDGLSCPIDFSQFFSGSVFEPLRDKDYFKKFFLEGWTVAWPNGADIAPETLHHIAENDLSTATPARIPR